MNDVGDTARSVERGNMTSTSALYNIDPTILQTFADALTPDKTMEIKKLRKKLKVLLILICTKSSEKNLPLLKTRSSSKNEGGYSINRL